MLRLGTIFSGIGAVEHALERLGVEHEIVFACDNGGVDVWSGKDEKEVNRIKKELNEIQNPTEKKKAVDNLYNSSKKTNFVKQSYFANYPMNDEKWHYDVTLLDGKPYKGKIDLFVGGSPCQSFSTAGNRKGLEDTRGTLFYEFARLVQEIQPKVFIYENVKGMLTHDKGNTWNVIQNVFEELGYDYSYQLINAKEHGIPQSRPRIFVVGFRKEMKFEFPLPKELTLKMQDFLEESENEYFYIKEKKPKKKMERKTIDEKYFLSEKIKKTILATGTKGFRMKPTIDTEIAKTLLATMHKMHRAGTDNYVTTNGRLRRLTPREALRLMGFCDSFKQVVSDTQMYRQAGNSIVVDVLMAILDKIFETNVFE